jgi:ABC-type transporter Mla subunit MlaD
MNEQAMRFRIGVFVLAAMLLLAVLITLFGSFPRVLTRTHEYTIRFADAGGVTPGTPVRRSGVRVGEVRSVELDDETGEVRVRIGVERQYSLRRHEQPTLVQGLLGGDVSIDFIPRPPEGEQPPDRSAVEPGAELAGVRQADVGALLGQASAVVPATQETLNEIRKSLQRFDRLAPLMEETAKEYRDLAKETRAAVPELKQTNEEVRKAATEVGEAAKALREVVPEAKKTSDEVKKAATEIGELAKSMREAMPEFKKAATEIAELAKATRETLPEVKKTTTEVGELAKGAREMLPELKKTNTEAQVTLRTWDKLGERLRLSVETNEEKVVKLVDNLNDTVTRVGTLFSDENQRNLTATIKNVRAGTDNLPELSKNTEELLKETRGTMKQLRETLTKADALVGDVQQATKPLAERGPSVMKNLDESSGRLNAVLADVQALLRAIDKGDGTLRKLIADPSLYNHLDEAACALTKVLPRMERILRDVEVFADKIARHPESLGIGGAIRPSSGLKESPALPVQWGKPPGH